MYLFGVNIRCKYVSIRCNIIYSVDYEYLFGVLYVSIRSNTCMYEVIYINLFGVIYVPI